MDNLRHKTINSIFWTMTQQGGWQILRFVIGIILARLLSPQEFGLVAMITVITGYASSFADFGLGAALIQKQNITQLRLSSVFWLNIIIGTSITLLFIGSASLIADFYREPILTPLTMIISLNFLISAPSMVQRVLFQKSLDFRTLTLIDLIAFGIAGFVAIVMAYNNFGVWSLVWRSILVSTLTTLALWKMSNWRPSLTFRWQAVKELLGFSSGVLGTQTLTYWSRNVDNLLIGRFLGSQALGYYSRAFGLLLFPLHNITGVISRALFPAFSLMQDDKARVRRAYLRATRGVMFIVAPLVFGLFVTAEPFVMTVYGSRWSEMIPIVQILCLLGLTQSIEVFNKNLYFSQGRAGLQFKVDSCLKALAITGIVIGLRWGVAGVAVGYAIASVIGIYPSFRFAGKLIDLSFLELVTNISSTVFCSLGMALAVWFVGEFIPQPWPHWTHLLIQVALGFFVYAVLVHSFQITAYLEIRSLAVERFNLLRESRLSANVLAK